MASRALTARLTSAVSNWLGIGLDDATASAVDRVTICDARADQRARASSPTARTRSADVEHLRLQRLPAREGEQLAGELGAPGRPCPQIAST